jgi:hypothetical protein
VYPTGFSHVSRTERMVCPPARKRRARVCESERSQRLPDPVRGASAFLQVLAHCGLQKVNWRVGEAHNALILTRHLPASAKAGLRALT